jgi:ubiquinone/menaquinone biosynthesis C-methylase UbiE
MLPRVLETEAMDTLEEALDYDSMDHAAVNRVFVADVLAAARWGVCADAIPAHGRQAGETLDLGTGTAQIPIELCRQEPSARVLAVDAAQHMLQVARQNVQKAGLAERIRLQRVDAKRLPYRDGRFANVISNSIVHHLPDPSQVLHEAWRVAAPGGLIFFRDLFRPEDERTVRHLVETYTVGANRHQQQMFEDSLRAALTVEEIRRLLADLGLPADSVRATTDRHWTWVARKK